MADEIGSLINRYSDLQLLKNISEDAKRGQAQNISKRDTDLTRNSNAARSVLKNGWGNRSQRLSNRAGSPAVSCCLARSFVMQRRARCTPCTGIPFQRTRNAPSGRRMSAPCANIPTNAAGSGPSVSAQAVHQALVAAILRDVITHKTLRPLADALTAHLRQPHTTVNARLVTLTTQIAERERMLQKLMDVSPRGSGSEGCFATLHVPWYS